MKLLTKFGKLVLIHSLSKIFKFLFNRVPITLNAIAILWSNLVIILESFIAYSLFGKIYKSSSLTGATKWNLNGIKLYATGINLGIGTNNPSKPLHVIGNILSSNDISANNMIFATTKA